MSKIDSHNEVLRAISQIDGLPQIVWEGLGDLQSSAVKPRVEVQRGPSRDDRVGQSEVTRHTCDVQIVVVVEPGEMFEAQRIVRLLEDALYTNTRIADVIFVVSPLDVRPSLSEAGELRVPTYCRYMVLV